MHSSSLVFLLCVLFCAITLSITVTLYLPLFHTVTLTLSHSISFFYTITLSYTLTLLSSKAPSAGVTNLSSLFTGSTSVNISWLPPPRSDWNGLITQYSISYVSNDASIDPSIDGSVVLYPESFINGNNPRTASGRYTKQDVTMS